ncbi:MAG: hypothetical protein KJP26_10510, partial [Maribacter sp.]|nr:hypothetical protein [Maribacter sp.]
GYGNRSFNRFTSLFFSDYLPDIPISIATTLGTTISILLSFKISQSYDRWREARKIWGTIVNDSKIQSFPPHIETDFMSQFTYLLFSYGCLCLYGCPFL